MTSTRARENRDKKRFRCEARGWIFNRLPGLIQKSTARRILDQLAESIPANPPVQSVPRPVDDEGHAFNLVKGNKSPKPGVQALIPVVSHYKVGVYGDRYRAKVVALGDDSREGSLPVLMNHIVLF